MAKQKINLNEYAERILEKAEKGATDEQLLFFVTTYKTYQEQTAILEELAATRRNMDALVTKEYVKGRQNVVINPVITEFNKTATARNNTAATLIKIITALNDLSLGNDAADEFMEFLRK